uniref:Uncharacterized protein n=1 Tax=Lotharella oceanica TaxID=641309 RepID=A0A7S2TWT3_9EUKA
MLSGATYRSSEIDSIRRTQLVQHPRSLPGAGRRRLVELTVHFHPYWMLAAASGPRWRRDFVELERRVFQMRFRGHRCRWPLKIGRASRTGGGSSSHRSMM